MLIIQQAQSNLPLNHVSGHIFLIILTLTVYVLTIIIVPVTNAYLLLYTHFIIDYS